MTTLQQVGLFPLSFVDSCFGGAYVCMCECAGVCTSACVCACVGLHLCVYVWCVHADVSMCVCV